MAFYLRIFYLVLLTLIELLPSSCMHHPAIRGDTAPAPQKEWQPPCSISTFKPPEDSSSEETLESFRELSKNNKNLNIAQLLNLALATNPVTKQSWLQAQVQAYNWYKSQSTLYPYLDFQEIFQINDFNNSNDSSDDDVIVQEDNVNDEVDSDEENINAPNNSTASNSNTNANPRLSSFTSDLSLNYLLFDFGGRSGTIEAARQMLIAANWRHSQSIQQVLQAVIDSYYRLLGAQALVDAQKSSLEDALTNLQAASKLAEAGIKTNVDVLQAQSNAANSKLSLTQAEGQVRIILGQLATALGLPADTVFEIPEFPQTFPLNRTIADMETLIAEARMARPDLAAAQADFLKAQAQVDAARSARLPTLWLSGDLNRTTFVNHSFLNYTNSTGVLTLQMPLFHGGALTNQLRQAKAAAATAQAAWQTQDAAVLLDIVTSYVAFQTATASIGPSEDLLRYSEEAYKATLVKYKMGISTINELLDAQKTLADARSRHVQTRTQWVTSLVLISYSTGTLSSDFFEKR